MTRLLLVGLVLAGMVCVSGAIADQTIDQLGAAAAPSDSDLIAIESSGVAPAKQMSLATLRAYITAVQTPAFYVATTGSDSNAGTLAAPFLTFGKCQTAMQGSSIKTCYFRAGQYNLPAATTDPCFIGQNEAIMLGASDGGETYATYPPDGIGAAIIDGGSSGSQTGAPWGICLNAGTSTITFSGLTFQHFDRSAIYAMSPLTATNNIFQNFYNIQYSSAGFSLAAAITLATTTGGTTISNNYITQSVGHGLRLLAGASGGLSNLKVNNNFIYNVCTNAYDCGGIYVDDVQTTASTNISITNNYIRDVDTADGGTFVTSGGRNYGNKLYFDDGASNITATGNVLVGLAGACYFIHGGINNTIKNNFCDMATGSAMILINQGTPPAGNRGSTGNVFGNNITVGSSSGAVGQGYANFSSPGANPTMSANQVFNYGAGGSVSNGSTNSAAVDPNPQYASPLLFCWGALLGGGSPAYSSPVSFLPNPQPTLWDTTGYWGYTGFNVSHVGTAPSWPATNGSNGCLATN